MTRRGSKFLLLALRLGCLAAAALTGPAVAAQEEAAGEILMLTPPEGWIVAFQAREQQMYVVQYLPPGQNGENWDQMVQAQVFFGITALPPIQFLDNMQGLYEEACESVRAGPTDEWRGRGYSAAVRLMVCGRNPYDERGEVAMFKVIQGKESLYAVNRIWRGAPFAVEEPPLGEETLAQWAAFLAGVRLCDSRDPELRCPARSAQ